MPNSIQRQVAYKVSIGELIKGKYIRVEGDWEPNYIETSSNKRFSRVNIIGTVVLAEPDTVTLDDGTGSIRVRSFQVPDMFLEKNVGDVLLLIARPREFNDEIFLVPEIVRPITNPGWIRLRQLELSGELPKEVEKVKKQDSSLPLTDLIFRYIEENDKGDGVDIEEVISFTKNEDSEKIINSFLESGTIFEIKPGRVKILK